MRELRISASVPVPDEMFASASLLAKIHPVVDQFRAALAEIESSVTLEADIVTLRAKTVYDEVPQRKKQGETA